MSASRGGRALSVCRNGDWRMTVSVPRPQGASMSEIAQEVLLTNARVLTMADGPDHRADSLAMRAGRIVAVGSRRDAFEAVSHGAVIYDLGGRTVMPGLVDTHTHLCATASWRRRVDCRDLYHSSIDSIDAILTSMRVAAEGKSPGELIAGTGSAMQEFRIKEKRLPTRRELDDAVPDHPAFIMFGAHITVANSRASAPCRHQRCHSGPARWSHRAR